MAAQQQAEPGEELLRSWIQTHGALFLFECAGTTYYYRRLSRREYRLLLLIEDEIEREDEAVSTCLLWPDNWQSDELALAGHVSQIAGEILKNSGCVDLQQTIARYEQQVTGDLELQMEGVIDYVFSGGGDLERYADWSYDKLFKTYAQAKWIATNLMGHAVTEQRTAPPVPRNAQEAAALRAERIARRREAHQQVSSNADMLSQIPEDDGTPMALRPMHEVMRKTAIAQHKAALMSAAKNIPSKPIERGP
jgi:hypothetical protein